MMTFLRYNFDLLGIDYLHFPAVDGRKLDEKYLQSYNIKVGEDWILTEWKSGKDKTLKAYNKS